MVSLKSFEELEVWQISIGFTEAVYLASRQWPSEERFGLTQQVRRATASIPANIAEGSERNSTKDFLRFLGIAKGSLAETKTFLILAEKLAYLDQAESAILREKADQIGRMLSGLINALRRKL